MHPRQFKVNDAWIAFRINGAPVRTERDGDFNCIALMDAASCFILGMELVPIQNAEASPFLFRRLLKSGERHKMQLPKKLYIARNNAADELTDVAKDQEIEVVMAPEKELLIFIGEARQGFAERFGEPQQ